MSIRTTRIPGAMLGLGTFVNSDIDAKRMLILHGELTWTAADFDRTLTQGATRMATIKTALVGNSHLDDKGSASMHVTVSTFTNGTLIFRIRNCTSGGAATNNRATKTSYWIVGSPDPNRIII